MLQNMTKFPVKMQYFSKMTDSKTTIPWTVILSQNGWKICLIFWRPTNPDHARCLLHFWQHEPIPRVVLAEQHGGELHLQVCILFISFEMCPVESSCFFSQFNQVNLAYTMSSAAVFSLTPVLLLPTIGYAGVMVLGTALRELNLES